MVTGVGRRTGIGFAIARYLLDSDVSVLIHSFAPVDGDDVDTLVEELGGPSDLLGHVDADLGDADAPRRVVERAVETFGGVDVLVVNHAHGSDRSLGR